MATIQHIDSCDDICRDALQTFGSAAVLMGVAQQAKADHHITGYVAMIRTDKGMDVQGVADVEAIDQLLAVLRKSREEIAKKAGEAKLLADSVLQSMTRH